MTLALSRVAGSDIVAYLKSKGSDNGSKWEDRLLMCHPSRRVERIAQLPENDYALGDLLIVAASRGWFDVVKYLLDDMEYDSTPTLNILEAAVVGDHLAVVQYLTSRPDSRTSLSLREVNHLITIACHAKQEILNVLFSLRKSLLTPD